MWLPHIPPTGKLALNPGMCPDWESNRQPFDSQVGTQSTELHQPGHNPTLSLCHEYQAQKGLLPALILPRGKLETEPRSVDSSVQRSFCLTGLVPSTLLGSPLAMVGTSPSKAVCVVFLVGSEFCRLILWGFLKGFTRPWTVCAFLLQVNNKVVHTEFRLREEPIKVSLVMESTLTKSVYF